MTLCAVRLETMVTIAIDNRSRGHTDIGSTVAVAAIGYEIICYTPKQLHSLDLLRVRGALGQRSGSLEHCFR